MSPRFITNLIVLLAGGAVVVCSQWLSAGTTGWIAFGVALGILGLTGVAQRERGRGIVQSALDVVILLLAAWSAIASVVFHGSTLTWLSFGNALGFVGLAWAFFGYSVAFGHASRWFGGGEYFFLRGVGLEAPVHVAHGARVECTSTILGQEGGPCPSSR